MSNQNISNYQLSADFISGKTNLSPETAIVLGSGLGDFAEKLQDACVIPYGEIPGFVKSTAPGHKGRIVVGKADGTPVVCMQGRFHYYEGYPMSDIIYPIRVMKKIGIKKLILTNAAGCVNTDFNPGEFMLLKDHINFLGTNPLIGPNDNEFGVRFPDMTHTYDKEMGAAVKAAAAMLGITLREGVYLACTGPTYETPAEIRAFRVLGADAVGMSTVPEAIAANQCGIRVCAISCITNMAAGILDAALSEQEVIDIAGKSGEAFVKLINTAIQKM